MNQTYIQAQGPGDWARFLAEPEKQWRRGYSARTLAHSWHAVGCFPPEVQNAFASSSSFRDISLLLAIPEHQVVLPGGRRPSQNDIWVLARTPETLVSIAVEGKVSEPFGPTVRELNPDGSKGRRTKKFQKDESTVMSKEAGQIIKAYNYREGIYRRQSQRLTPGKSFCGCEGHKGFQKISAGSSCDS